MLAVALYVAAVPLVLLVVGFSYFALVYVMRTRKEGKP